MNITLREITIEDENEIIALCKEVKENDVENTFEGLSNIKNVDNIDFKDFLLDLEKSKNIKDIKPNLVNQTTYMMFDENNRVLGGVNIRYELNDNLLKHGGHIGALIRPSERKKGYATKIIPIKISKTANRVKNLFLYFFILESPNSSFLTFYFIISYMILPYSIYK